MQKEKKMNSIFQNVLYECVQLQNLGPSIIL